MPKGSSREGKANIRALRSLAATSAWEIGSRDSVQRGGSRIAGAPIEIISNVSSVSACTTSHAARIFSTFFDDEY
jgi:predicted secreted protein